MYIMTQVYECSECHKDMATDCECFEVVLDFSTKMDDLMKLVDRLQISKVISKS